MDLEPFYITFGIMLFISVIAFLGVFITLATHMSGANAQLLSMGTLRLSDNFLCFLIFSVVLSLTNFDGNCTYSCYHHHL